jgi:hypothetical protein
MHHVGLVRGRVTGVTDSARSCGCAEHRGFMHVSQYDQERVIRRRTCSKAATRSEAKITVSTATGQDFAQPAPAPQDQ